MPENKSLASIIFVGPQVVFERMGKLPENAAKEVCIKPLTNARVYAFEEGYFDKAR